MDTGPQLRSQVKSKAVTLITVEYQILPSPHQLKGMTTDKQKEFTRAKVEGLLKDTKFIYRVPSDTVSEFEEATT
jgi:hypothetical protein